MKVLSLGSLNIDYNYFLNHIMQAKETQAALRMDKFPGGKGLNQSIAMAKAGLEVYHAGFIGEDGDMLLEILQMAGVDTRLVCKINGRSGHAIIQVDNMGQNSVMIYGGANDQITPEYIDEVLECFDEQDVLVLQNEIANVSYAIERAYKKHMLIVLNPSPFNDNLKECDLSKVSLFFINEIEGRQLTTYVQPGDILIRMRELYPKSRCVLTLGQQGAFYQDIHNTTYHPAIKVSALDSTAAGDIFEGYFLAACLTSQDAAWALKTASYAAGISVSRRGAALSAPTMEETLQAIKAQEKK